MKLVISAGFDYFINSSSSPAAAGALMDVLDAGGCTFTLWTLSKSLKKNPKLEREAVTG